MEETSKIQLANGSRSLVKRNKLTRLFPHIFSYSHSDIQYKRMVLEHWRNGFHGHTFDKIAFSFNITDLN